MPTPGLFSSEWKETRPDRHGQAITSAFDELRAHPKSDARALLWPGWDSVVAASLTVHVDLPSRGPVKGVDIRPQEPILLVFDVGRYPYRAPRVRSDRRDFPSQALAHLNPVPPGEPPDLCLYRGNLDDWFADHDLSDLLDRVRGWLRDAARDRLIPVGDAWEPTRIGYASCGMCMFQLSSLLSIVRKDWQRTKGAAGCAVVKVFMREDPESLGLDAKALVLRVEAVRGQAKHRRQDEIPTGPLKHGITGLLVWPPQDKVCADYFGELPSDLRGLQQLGQRVGVSIQGVLDSQMAVLPQRLAPIILAVQRPQTVLGTDSSIELLSFVVWDRKREPGSDSGFSPESRVFAMGHRDPMTPDRARDLSAVEHYQAGGPVAIVGCGAVGSKLALHLARAGWTRLLLVDDDYMSPHNLVRHALLGSSLGMNKAEATRDAILSVYPGEVAGEDVQCYAGSVFDLLADRRSALGKPSLVVDCTASYAVLQALAGADLPDGTIVARCEIADQGRLGLLAVEGSGRNPRIDDLRCLLWDAALDDDQLSSWLISLKHEDNEQVGSGFQEVAIGMGCSSETLRLADDVVSLYAAVFSTTARGLLIRSTQHPDGRLHILRLPSGPGALPATQELPFRRLKVLAARNDPRWEVRMRAEVADEIATKAQDAAPNETGGLLVGCIHPKRRIIYVTRGLPAPPDSIERPYAFKRGIQDAPESVRQVEARTAGLLGYVGEWHSHPNGHLALSEADLQAARQLHRHLAPVGLPTQLVVVTPRSIQPYVFGPGESP